MVKVFTGYGTFKQVKKKSICGFFIHICPGSGYQPAGPGDPIMWRHTGSLLNR